MSKNFNKVLKRFNRNNNDGVRSRDSSGGSTSVLTPRRNTTSNTGNFDVGSRNRSAADNNLESNTRNKGI